MKRQTKQLLLYVALLVLTLGVAVLVPSWGGVNYVSFIYYLVVLAPLLIVPLVFGFMLRSWRQFVVYLSVTVLGWHLSFVALYWVLGRLSETLWLKYEEGTWGYEILKNCMMPVLLVSVGAIMGRLRRIHRLR
jgi:hypothetical protein